MRIALVLALLASSGRVYDASQAIRVRRSDRGQVNSGAVAAPPASSLLTGLLAYWPLQTNSTDSLGLHNGTDTRVTYSSGATFPTNDGSIGIANLDTTATYTISLWVNPVNPVGYTDGFGEYFGNVTQSQALLAHNSRPYWAAAGGGPFSATLVAGALTHLLIRATGTTATLYVNGALDGTSFADSTAIVLSRIGAFNAAGSECIGGTAGNGKLQHIGVWSRALTTTEIAVLYNSGTPKPYPF